MEHKFLRLYKNGVWCGSPDRTIRVDGVEHNLDEYAKKHGIQLPDAKQKVNNYADLEQPLDSGDTEVDGTGDSQSEE